MSAYLTHPQVRWPGHGSPPDMAAHVGYVEGITGGRLVLVNHGRFRVIGATDEDLNLPGDFATLDEAIAAALAVTR